MKSVPGTLQEGGAPFQTTHWTLVLQARQIGATEPAQQALTAFCETYWPPLYAFLRHRRYASSDAQDLVQAFFAHLLAQNIAGRMRKRTDRLAGVGIAKDSCPAREVDFRSLQSDNFS